PAHAHRHEEDEEKQHGEKTKAEEKQFVHIRQASRSKRSTTSPTVTTVPWDTRTTSRRSPPTKTPFALCRSRSSMPDPPWTSSAWWRERERLPSTRSL